MRWRVRNPEGALRASCRGFSLIEVVFAAAVMGIGFAAAAVCLKTGMNMLDAARRDAQVSQAMQDEMEQLRLENWIAIEALPARSRLEQNLPAAQHNALLGDMVARQELEIERIISDVAGQTGLKHIQITARWRGIDGRQRTRIYHMRYARGGISDYYYGTLN